MKRPFAAATEQLERRMMCDMVYPGDGPVEPHEEPAEYVLGSKWAQSALGSAVNLTYSYSDLLNGGMLGGLSAAVLESGIEEALQVWSAVAPLRLTEVADSGPAPSEASYSASTHPKLRFGHHFIDGADGPNTLAHAYYPSTSGLGGDTHFDSGNTWSITPTYPGIDILEVATHEIGHALGLNHDSATSAIMNPTYAGRYSGLGSAFLLQDDINGIRAQYGSGLGYVVSDGVLYVSGTESADTMSVDVSGSTITLSRFDSSMGAPSVATADVAGISQIVVNSRGGNDTINVLGSGALSVVVHSGSGNDAVNVNSDNTGLASVVFDQNDEKLAALNIGDGGTVTLAQTAAAGANVLTAQALSMSGGARLNLNNGGMIVDYSSGTPYADVNSWIASAFTGGSWSGDGIQTDSADAGRYAVAMAEANGVLGTTGGAWLNRAVDGSALLIRFTYAGDADLNGRLDGDDYFLIDSYLAQSGSVFGYYYGDFNYDDSIDGDDYFAIDSNIAYAQVNVL